MSAPHVRQAGVGLIVLCSECRRAYRKDSAGKVALMRLETAADFEFKSGLPRDAWMPGPLGFVLRCDTCGWRVQLTGDRLPTVAMLSADAKP